MNCATCIYGEDCAGDCIGYVEAVYDDRDAYYEARGDEDRESDLFYGGEN